MIQASLETRPRSSRARRLSALLLAALAALVPITAPLAGQSVEPAGDFVHRSGASFVRGGEPYRFVGVNARSLLWDEYEWGHVDDYLAAANDMGVKVIRIYVARSEPGWTVETLLEVAIDRLTTLFAKVETAGYDIKFLLCLTDVHYDPNLRHVVPGDESFYVDNRLSPSWFASGYTRNYLKLVDGLQKVLFNEDAIFAWQLGNELQVIGLPGSIDNPTPNRDTMLGFAYTVGRRLRVGNGSLGLPPVQQMITPGFISVRHAIGGEVGPGPADEPRVEFYVAWCNPNCLVSPFLFMGIHTYDNRHSTPVGGPPPCDGPSCPHGPNGEYDDVVWSRGVGQLPLVVGEGSFGVGLEGGPAFPGGWWRLDQRSARICPTANTAIGRAPATRRTVASFFDLAGADGFLQWNYLPDSESGMTDAWAMGKIVHNDFDRMTRVYRTQAVRLERGASLGIPARWNGLSGPFCIDLVARETEIEMVAWPGPPVVRTVQIDSLSDVSTTLLVSENVPWLAVSPTQGTIGAGQTFPLQLTGLCTGTPGIHETVVDVRLYHPTNGQQALEKLFVRLDCRTSSPDACVSGELFYWNSNQCVTGPVNSTVKLDLYDPMTDTWVYVGDVPVSNGDFCVNLLRNRLYALREDDVPAFACGPNYYVNCFQSLELTDPGASGLCGGDGCEELGPIDFFCGS